MKKGIVFLVMVSALHAQTISDAITLFQNGQMAQAKPILEREIERNPSHAEAYYYLGLIWLRHGRDVDKAVEYLEQATELDASNGRYFFDLGRALGAKAQASNFVMRLILAPKVKSAFERAVELDGHSIEARQGLIQFYILAPGVMGGSLSKAREHANVLVSQSPYHGYYAHAVIANADDDLKSVEAYCRKATDANPKSGAPYHMLGYIYLRKGRIDDAIAQFKKMAEAEPENANSFDSLGDGYMAKQMTTEALACYQKAIQIDPAFSPSVYNVGLCYEKMGKSKEAKEQFRQYLNIAPSGVYARDARSKLAE